MEYYGRSLALVARRLRKGMGVTLVDTFSYFFLVSLADSLSATQDSPTKASEPACV